MEVARRSEPSVLRQRSFEGMSADSWMTEIQNEMLQRCPMVHSILSALLEINVNPDKKGPAMCLIYSMIMFLRCREMSRIQRINTILFTEGQVPVKVSLILFLLI